MLRKSRAKMLSGCRTQPSAVQGSDAPAMEESGRGSQPTFFVGLPPPASSSVAWSLLTLPLHHSLHISDVATQRCWDNHAWLSDAEGSCSTHFSTHRPPRIPQTSSF